MSHQRFPGIGSQIGGGHGGEHTARTGDPAHERTAVPEANCPPQPPRRTRRRRAAAAVSAMGLCGQIAWKRMQPADGNVSYRTYLLDAVCDLTPEILEKGADYETR